MWYRAVTALVDFTRPRNTCPSLLWLSGGFAHCYPASRLQHKSVNRIGGSLPNGLSRKELHSQRGIRRPSYLARGLQLSHFLRSISTQYNY